MQAGTGSLLYGRKRNLFSNLQQKVFRRTIYLVIIA
jgi:hypothetical protein